MKQVHLCMPFSTAVSHVIVRTLHLRNANLFLCEHCTLQVARYTASRPEKKETLDVLEAAFLKLLEGAKPTAEVRRRRLPSLHHRAPFFVVEENFACEK